MPTDIQYGDRVPRPGDRQVSAAFLRAVVAELTRQGRVWFEGGVAEAAPGGTLLRALPGLELVPARLTAEASGAYAWKELTRSALNAWADKTGGRTGTTTASAARDVNGATGLTVGASTGTVVWLVKGFGEASTAAASPGTVNQEWLFDHAAGGGVTVDTENNGTGDASFSHLTGTVHVDQGSGLKWATGDHLSVQPASATHAGAVTNATQLLGGAKTIVPGGGTGGDASYGLGLRNHATLASANAALAFYHLGLTDGSYLEASDPSAGGSSVAARLQMLPGDATWTANPRPVFRLNDSNTGKSAALVIMGGDGTDAAEIWMHDAAGTAYPPFTGTVPAGKQPIFVGGVCVGHTP